MMRKATIFALAAFLCITANAQTDSLVIKKNIKSCADSMANAFMSKDWKTYTRFTIPSLVEMLGGEDGFIDFTVEMLSEMPDSSIKDYKTGEVVQLVKTPGNWQSVVEQFLSFEADSMVLNSVSYLIGVSIDGGKAWKFFDPQGEHNNAIILLPDLSPDIIIPKTKDDLRYKNKTL